MPTSNHDVNMKEAKYMKISETSGLIIAVGPEKNYYDIVNLLIEGAEASPAAAEYVTLAMLPDGGHRIVIHEGLTILYLELDLEFSIARVSLVEGRMSLGILERASNDMVFESHQIAEMFENMDMLFMYPTTHTGKPLVLIGAEHREPEPIVG